MLAIARGRLAEGIDFTDELARAVYLIGIPNLSINELYIQKKIDYLNTKKGFRQGDKWYEM